MKLEGNSYPPKLSVCQCVPVLQHAATVRGNLGEVVRCCHVVVRQTEGRHVNASIQPLNSNIALISYKCIQQRDLLTLPSIWCLVPGEAMQGRVSWFSVMHCSLSVYLTVLHCPDKIFHVPSLLLYICLRWCTALGRKLLSSCVALRLASIKQQCVPEIREAPSEPSRRHTHKPYSLLE